MSTIVLRDSDPEISDHIMDTDKSDGNCHLGIIL